MTTRALPLLALALGAALGTSLGGCVGDAATLEFSGICAPPVTASPCLDVAISGSLCINGILGTRPYVYTTVGGTPNDLQLAVSMLNQLPNNADPSYGQVNTNDADIESWVYTFDTGGYPIQDTSWSEPAGGITIPAGLGSTPGGGTPLVPLLPTQIVTELKGAMPAGVTATVISNVRAKGHLKDGSPFETSPYPVSIDVINSDITYTCSTAGDTPQFCPKAGQTMTFPFACAAAP